ncbi:Armadillo-type fold [Cinara cedri]|uniref:Armadillo-type fold n=1 Tax=Cinara cedri TaxID=506608 RepID=A0A5E4NM67_9HEMI|nr:Armadillo-type fold [Cinara cedri]
MPFIHEEIINKSSDCFQRVSWNILNQSISALVKNIKSTLINDIPKIKNKLLYLNIITGKGLLCSSIMREQLNSGMDITYKYAFLMSLINCEFSEIGILLLKRCLHNFFCEYYRSALDKHPTHRFSYLSFIAHLVNYGLAHPIVAVDLVKLFLKKPTEESIKMAFIVIHTCGHHMRKMCSVDMDDIANTDLNSLGNIDSGVKFKINITIFGLIKNNKYSSIKFPTIGTIDYKNTHLFKLNDYIIDPEAYLNYYAYKPTCDAETYRLYYEQFILTENNRDNYLLIYDIHEGLQENTMATYNVKNIPKNMKFIKRTISELVTNWFIFDYETNARKLMKLKIEQGQETMVCALLMKLCYTTKNNYAIVERIGYITQIFVQLDEFFVKPLEQSFPHNYLNAHIFNPIEIICISKYYAHLLFSDTISWDVFSIIDINTMDKNNDSRQLIFVVTLFYELLNNLGYDNLANRICSEFNIKAFEKIFLLDGAIELFQSMKLEKFVYMYKQSYNSMKYYLKDN